MVTREVPKSPDPRPNSSIPTTKANKVLEKKMMMRPKAATIRLDVSATLSPNVSAKIPPGNWLNAFEAANELSKRPATVFPIENSSFIYGSKTGKMTSTPKRSNCPNPTVSSTRREPEVKIPLDFFNKFSTMKISKGEWDNGLDLP